MIRLGYGGHSSGIRRPVVQSIWRVQRYLLLVKALVRASNDNGVFNVCRVVVGLQAEGRRIAVGWGS